MQINLRVEVFHFVVITGNAAISLTCLKVLPRRDE
jgi:hypothetical protein